MNSSVVRGMFAACVLCWMVPHAALGQWVTAPSPAVSVESNEPREDHPEAATAWFYGQRSYGSKEVTSALREQAIVARDAMRVMPKFGLQSAPPQWKLVGPVNTISSTDPPAHDGRINTIAVHPTNPRIAYCGAAMGGVWKTTDQGGSWTALTDQTISLAMGALAIDANPNIIYAGTGEFSSNVDSYFGSGIIKSTDAGATWHGIGLNTAGAFSRIIAHPSISGRVYAAAAKSGGGIWRTDDGGKTWTKLANGLPPAEVTDLSLSVQNGTDILYAGLPSHGIYKSNDGGATWSLAMGDPPFIDMRRVHVDSYPTDPKHVVALSVDRNGAFEALIASDDGGQTWGDISGSLRSNSIFSSGGSEQGWYDAYVKMDPAKAAHIVVGGISIWDSPDEGNSWTDNGNAYAPGGIHPDQHALAFAPSNPSIVYAGNDGGIAMSSDGGSNYTYGKDNLAIVQFYGIDVDQSVAERTIGGTQDNGTQAGGIGDWNETLGGDGGTVTINQNDPSTYWEWQPTTLEPARVSNSGATPLNLPRVYNGPQGFVDDSAWIKQLVFDSKSSTLYAATNFFYYSKNLGSSWTRRGLHSTNVTDTSDITSIFPLGDGNTVVVGTSKGKVYTTTNNGQAWADHTAGLPTRTVTSVTFGPSGASKIYVTFSGFGGGHVFKSDNGGAAWSDISSNIPDIPCNALVVDPQNPKVLYLGTDVGVFFTPDEGATWIPYGAGLPNSVVSAMVIHTGSRTLRVGTHGRSVWEVPLSVDVPGITSPTNGAVWYTGDNETVSWHGLAGSVTVELSLDGGQTWIQLGIETSASLGLNPMHYPSSDNALIRVRTATDTLTSPLFRIAQRKAGQVLSYVGELPIYMYDIAWDPDNKVLWATDFSQTDTKIYKVDPDLGTMLGSINLGAGHANLTGIKYSPELKHLFIHQSHAADAGQSFFYEVTTTGQTVKHTPSPAEYGTGILVRQDTIYFVDRNPSSGFNTIHTQSLSHGGTVNDIPITSRFSLFGPRCLTYNPTTDRLLNTWTDFQAADTTSATTLYDSYLVQFAPTDMTELASSFLQVGNNSVNVRGLEIDPRDGYKSAWVTILDDAAGGTSAKLYKVALVDGPVGNLGVETPIHAGDYSLGQNYPNPFNPTTTIPYELRASGVVQIRVVDIMGNEVMATSPKYEPAGHHEQMLNLLQLPSGAYAYELTIGGVAVSHRKMILMK